VCLFRKVAEGILPCKIDQTDANPKENWYKLARKKIDQQTVLGLEC
jgi:hypothetical protein